MAKKKEFDNIVEETFYEGYKSEPEYERKNETNTETETKESEKNNGPSETELRLRKIIGGDEEVLNEVYIGNNGELTRSTYYFTDVHRACVDIVAHKEGIKKNDVVLAAFDKYFGEKIIKEARELVVSREIKKLEKEIENEKTNK